MKVVVPKAVSLILLVALLSVAAAAVVAAPADKKGHFNPATLGDKVAAACKPGVVSDWHVDYTDESLLQVTCYNAKTQEVKSTVVER